MTFKCFDIKGPLLLQTPVHGDARGSFYEAFHLPKLIDALGFNPGFVQDNISRSATRGTVRGMHLQTPPAAQAKLLRCIQGAILDVIVDVRAGSATYGKALYFDLTQDDGQSLWIPEGFLHGFATKTDDVVVAYKVTDHYNHDCDLSIAWDDADLGIDWQLGDCAPTLSDKDKNGLSFADFTSPFKALS
ncbi:MAG: dTDP-4-dehydrorhamnose 3,5-epimerase [Alphaproteobacteria bacterium]